MNRDTQTVARRLGISEADLTSRVGVVRKVGYERERSHAAIDLIVDASRTRCVVKQPSCVMIVSPTLLVSGGNSYL